MLHRSPIRALRVAAIVAVLGIVLLGTITGTVQSAAAASDNSRVFPPNAHPYGKSLGEWGAAWWEWMSQYPYAENPIADDGMVQYGDADEQPQGNVWYLAGTFGGPGERWLDVPKGKSLLVPLVNWDAWSPEDCWWIGVSEEPNGCNAEDIQGFLDGFFTENVTDLSLTLDGTPISDLFDHRATSGPFTLAIEPDTLWTDFGYTAGARYPNLSDGYYVMVKPLKNGEHTLHFTADVDGDTFQNMTYHLNVLGE